MATTTPTFFSWPSGPHTVQVSGDWDNWTEKITLDKQTDGSFSKQISLPSNNKVHYKYVVDGNWTTSSTSPLVDDAGNQNNVVEVGPALTEAEAATAKAGEIGAGVAAGAVGLATAAGAAAMSFTNHVNGETTGDTAVKEAEPTKEISEAEKSDEPAAALKSSADDDIRNKVPTSITSATHAIVPVLAGALATVTGADILRGSPEALPVTDKEVKDTQAKAMKGDNAFLASRIEPQGGAITDPGLAETENAKVAATVAKSATVGEAVVPVTHNGFAANVTADTGNLTTGADAGKTGGEKAGAVAAASAGALGATVAGAASVSSPASNDTKTAAEPMSKPITTAPDSKASNVTTGENISKKAADKAAAPAAASSGPLLAGKETTTPAKSEKVTPAKSLPVTPSKQVAAEKSTPTPKEGSRISTLSNSTKKSNADVVASPSHTANGSTSSSNPATPERKKKPSIFNKIKTALGSPAK
ncbi:hypothetical protein CBS101457_003933 [Exobasidium rhododendri]|nr:hypothetical protein CBS101457_003933 [Exobasidium rhododendri]